MTTAFSRRDFLFIGGATVAGVTLGQAGRRVLARGDERLQSSRGSGVERRAATVCRECPAGCGVSVRLVDGVPVKLEGNPSCPIGRGRLCAKGQAGLEAYFDPDRLVGPARRIGKRGEHRWQAITWDAAVDLLASHVAPRSETPVSRPLVLAAEEHGPVAAAWSGFWDKAGAECAWTLGATPSRLRPAFAALTGLDRDPVFDLEHATNVLSFGAPLADDWLSPVWAQRSYGRFRRGPSRTRGRLVQIDAHRSMTACKADEWIAVPLEQQTTLTYGLASVILGENRANREFLQALGGNLERFQKEVIETYPPDEVAGATDVPVVTLLRLARDLAAGPRPVAVCAAEAPAALASAVFALNGLLGAFDRDGGVLASPAPPVEGYRDGTQALLEIQSGARRPRLVAFRDASALRALGAPVDTNALLENVPLVVSFSPYLDETADVADLLLPAPTPLESWHGLNPPAAVAAESVALSRPAVAARLNARDPLAVLAASARKAASSQRWPGWVTTEDVVNAEIDRLFAARRGGPWSNVHEAAWLRQLETGGWWVSSATSRDAFAAKVLDAGGWNDPYFEPGVIRTTLRDRSGMSWPDCRLTLRTQGRARTAMRSVTLAPDEEFPLRLMVFTPSVVALVGGANHAVLFEILGQPEGKPWRVWAELSPETARERGIADGSGIRIVSERGGGAIDAVAVVVDGMARDVIAVAYVPVAGAGGRWARLLRADARTLLGNRAATPIAVRVVGV